MNIICAGFGGQGVLTAGLILGETAAASGKHVTWIPSYGSEMRGGTANCHLKISDRRISSPFIQEIDVLIVMNRPSLDKFESSVRTGGLVVSNRSLIDAHDYPQGVEVAEVDATEIAEKLGNPKGSNLAMLGALAKTGFLMDLELIQQGTLDFFAKKGKENPKNKDCIRQAYEQTRLLHN